MAGKFTITTGKDGKSYFSLKAGNGEIILQSQGYASLDSCKNGIESVRKNSQDEKRFEKKTAANGTVFFTLNATNGQIIGKSQMYKTESGRDNGITSVSKNAPDAKVVDESA
ncbi:MAG: YegP family protein [Chromatiales bacterium]|nr:YegP family protein [Chromatiales bacterium]